MNDMLKKIINANESDLLERKSAHPISDLEKQINQAPKTLDFYGAFEKNLGIIAEIKLASPSAGELEKSENILDIAAQYKSGRVDAISIITEKYFFKGDSDFIKAVKEKTDLPILQKDFVIDPYQIYESRINGADALLLIAKIISPDQLKKFVDLCLEIGLEPVVEINDELDLENALQTKTKQSLRPNGLRIIAVNARDLNTFKVDVDKACGLIKKIPNQYLKLGFSGVNSKQEVEKYKKVGARGVLVGTSLMKAKSKKEFLEGLK